MSSEAVVFKGTRYGVIISLRDDEDFSRVFSELKQKLQESQSFFTGSAVSLELGWRSLKLDELNSLCNLLEQFGLNLLGIISASQVTQNLAKEQGLKVIIGRLGLSEHKGRKQALSVREPVIEAPLPAADLPLPALYEEACILRRTVRSGQKLTFPGNLVLLGDLNAGGEVEAGGDIIVLGAIRGNAHCGCEGKQEAIIFAFELPFNQIKIAGIPALEAERRKVRKGGPFIGKLENGKVVFLPYKKSEG